MKNTGEKTYTEMFAEKRAKDAKKNASDRAFAPTAERLLKEVAYKNKTTPEHVEAEIEKFIDECWKQDKMKEFGLFDKKPSIEEYIFKVGTFLQIKMELEENTDEQGNIIMFPDNQ